MRKAPPWRGPAILAGLLMVLAAIFSGYVFIAERTDVAFIEKRFQENLDRGNLEQAIIFGERAESLRAERGDSDEQLMALRQKLARTHLEIGNYTRGAQILETMVVAKSWRQLPPAQQLSMEKDLAAAHILSGNYEKGVPIFSAFLSLAGNATTHIPAPSAMDLQSQYARAVYEAGPVFAREFKPGLDSFSNNGANRLSTDAAGQLATAKQMTALGAFYSLQQSNHPAATGLLSAAYNIRSANLPAQSRDLTQIALILGPLYQQSKRYEDAEKLYLQAFHAQEVVLGPDSTDFTLYIKLLADVYRQQGRLTESRALNRQIRAIFTERFGRLRHSLTQQPPATLVQSISPENRVPASYQPQDLVTASDYLIPVNQTNVSSRASSANGRSDDVALRLAGTSNGDNMPVRLSQLMALCGQDGRDEALSLASGFRRQDSDETAKLPGHSEHQLGLAVDLNVNGRLMRQSDSSWLCFRENAWKFGFLLSFPQGNSYGLANAQSADSPAVIDSFEPWHWRYVGVETTRLFREYGPLSAPQEFLTQIGCFQNYAQNKSQEIGGTFVTDPEDCLGLINEAAPDTINSAQNSISNSLVAATALTQDTEYEALIKARQNARAHSPLLMARGRFSEAKQLLITAMQFGDKVENPAEPLTGDHTLDTGMLATLYKNSGMELHAHALSGHITDRLRSTYSGETVHVHDDHPSTDKALNSFGSITRPVSQYFILQADYQPNDLIAANDYGIPVSKDPNLDEMKLRLASHDDRLIDAASLPIHLSQLIDLCSADNPDESLSLRSGYRAFETQVSLYQRLRHRGTVTPPGMSEHQTGLAADIDVNGRFMREGDKSYGCFSQNAHDYGFILSYPKGNRYLPGADTFEPWHWRYVGKETAQLYKNHGPEGKPQEFLAALPCYEKQAEARNAFYPEERTDFCLYDNVSGLSALPEPPQTNVPFVEEASNDDALLVNGENASSARNLNKVLRSGDQR